MDNNLDIIGEKFPTSKDPETNPEDAAKAEEWETAMEDAPNFSGEWGYSDPASETSSNHLSPNPENTETSETPPVNIETPTTPTSSGAEQLTDYGIDTASRLYGLSAVLDAILETDETNTDSENPIASIYGRLAPSVEDRKFLFQEIQKDGVKNPESSEDSQNTDRLLVGMTPDGQFYDKLQQQDTAEQTSVDAIRALRRLIDLLESSEKFADLRQKAAEHQLSIVDYLTSGENSPTLSYLLDRINQSTSEDNLEELAEELTSSLDDEPTADLENESPEPSPSSNLNPQI